MRLLLKAPTEDQSRLPYMEDLSGTPWTEDDKQRKKEEGSDTETSTKIVGQALQNIMGAEG